MDGCYFDFKCEIMGQIYMESRLHGFLIDNDILFNVSKRTILYYNNESSEGSILLNVVSLNETQARLLVYLLENSKSAVIDKNEIMKKVWDEFSLPSSNQRLWQTINELRKKLSSIGLSADFIENIHGMGYSVDNERVDSLFVSQV